MRVSQLLAAISCFAAATVLVVLAFKKHPAEKLYVNVVAAREAQLAAEAAEEETAATEEAPEQEPTEEESAEEAPAEEENTEE